MPLYDESGKAIIPTQTRKEYQEKEEASKPEPIVTEKTKYFKPKSSSSSSSSTTKTSSTPKSVPIAPSTSDISQTISDFKSGITPFERQLIDQAPKTSPSPSSSTRSSTSPSPSKTTQTISEEERQRIDERIAWADKQSGGVPGISPSPTIFDQKGNVQPYDVKSIGVGTKVDTKESISEGITHVERQPDKDTVAPTPYFEKFGYKPEDQDYRTIESDLSGSKKQIEESMKGIMEGTIASQQNLMQISKNVKMIGESPSDSRWLINDVEYSRDEALKIMSKGVTQNVAVVKQVSMMGHLSEQYKGIEDIEKTVKEHKGKGYTVDITDEGYVFGYPSAIEVHEDVVGDHTRSSVMLTASAFMESPLAIGTMVDIIAGKITGDPSYDERRIEKLAEFSLGLQESLQKGDRAGYVGKVLSSPAMVSGVYIPVFTLGAGYTIAGLSAGASQTGVATSTLAKFGATTAGKVTSTIGKAGLIGMGGVGVVTTGLAIGATAAKSPQDLPSMLSETAFTIGMAYGGFKAGEQMWTQRHTGSYHFDWDSGKTKWSDKEISKPKDVIGYSPDVFEVGVKPGETFFTSEGTQIVGGKPSNVWVKGYVEQVSGHPQYALAHGRGTISTAQTRTLFGRTIGTSEQMHVFDFNIPGKMLGQSGDTTIFSSKGWSQLLAGKPGAYGSGVFDPTFSRGVTGAKQIGSFKLESPISPDLPGMSLQESIFFSLGKYSGKQGMGRQINLGRVFSYDLTGGSGSGGGAIGESVSSTGLVQKLDYGMLFRNIGGAVSDVAMGSKIVPIPKLFVFSVPSGSSAQEYKSVVSGISIDSFQNVMLVPPAKIQKVENVSKTKSVYTGVPTVGSSRSTGSVLETILSSRNITGVGDIDSYTPSVIAIGIHQGNVPRERYGSITGSVLGVGEIQRSREDTRSDLARVLNINVLSDIKSDSLQRVQQLQHLVQIQGSQQVQQLQQAQQQLQRLKTVEVMDVVPISTTLPTPFIPSPTPSILIPVLPITQSIPGEKAFFLDVYERGKRGARKKIHPVSLFDMNIKLPEVEL